VIRPPLWPPGRLWTLPDYRTRPRAGQEHHLPEDTEGRLAPPLIDSEVPSLFQHVDVVLLADVVELLRPDRDRHLAEVRLAQKQHLQPSLADAAAD